MFEKIHFIDKFAHAIYAEILESVDLHISVFTLFG